MVAVAGVIKAVSMLLLLIPSFGPLITFLLLILYGLAGAILLLLLIAKATMSEEFELPIIGHIAQKQATCDPCLTERECSVIGNGFPVSEA